MMRLWLAALVLCFLGASIEGRNSLRSLQEDASPTADNREGEPADVFVEPPPATPPPTAADVAAAPSPADDGGDESPTADDAFDDAGDGGDDVATKISSRPPRQLNRTMQTKEE